MILILLAGSLPLALNDSVSDVHNLIAWRETKVRKKVVDCWLLVTEMTRKWSILKNTIKGNKVRFTKIFFLMGKKNNIKLRRNQIWPVIQLEYIIAS